MKKQAAKLNAAFLSKQGQRLLELGEELRSATHAHEAYERDVWRECSRDPWGYEDHEPRLACLEADANPMVRDLVRLACVDPVLDKIEDGAYGLSDLSGCPIPEGRLETLPEAICTWDVEQTFESAADRRRIQ